MKETISSKHLYQGSVDRTPVTSLDNTSLDSKTYSEHLIKGSDTYQDPRYTPVDDDKDVLAALESKAAESKLNNTQQEILRQMVGNKESVKYGNALNSTIKNIKSGKVYKDSINKENVTNG